MREFKIVQDERHFDEFVASHPYGHFMKTTAWGKFRVEIEKDEAYYPCVLLENEEIIASALAILTHRKGLGKVLYVPWGPCIDYEDQQLVQLMCDQLGKLAKEKKVTLLKIDLNVERVHHEIKGEVIDDGFNNEHITKMFESMGFKHKGYGYAYNGSWVNRFTLITSLQEEDYTQRIKKKVYKKALRNIRLGVSIRQGTDEEYETFAQFGKELSQTQHFLPKSADYFRNYVQMLQPYAKFMITEIDFNKRLAVLTEESQSKSLRKDKDALEAVLKNIEFCQNQIDSGKEKVMLCGAIYLHIGKKVFNMYLYNSKDYPDATASACSHVLMMEQMKKQGVEDFDFVGFATTVPNEPYYGLWDFKSSMGSRYVEYLGEFDMIYKPWRVQLTAFLKKIKKIHK
ncbi:MAG: peptidoglycan bridge formation glycyltransferase FemA/FemB family protein [Erysipelotrichaceae bacterium]|nr:peptidoglycan bridge formation glycyltransferase FemA/FemB family protein [Erysipelotrichaceae bacterium]